MSTKASHTPGPWKVECEPTRKDGFITGSDVFHSVVCQIRQYPGSNKAESYSNARLIAAAPTMYDYIAKKAGEGDAEAADIWEALNANRNMERP